MTVRTSKALPAVERELQSSVDSDHEHLGFSSLSITRLAAAHRQGWTGGPARKKLLALAQVPRSHLDDGSIGPPPSWN
jgi:hypothetical protein